jgi:hypothetical protein
MGCIKHLNFNYESYVTAYQKAGKNIGQKRVTDGHLQTQPLTCYLLLVHVFAFFAVLALTLQGCTSTALVAQCLRILEGAVLLWGADRAHSLSPAEAGWEAVSSSCLQGPVLGCNDLEPEPVLRSLQETHRQTLLKYKTFKCGIGGGERERKCCMGREGMVELYGSQKAFWVGPGHRGRGGFRGAGHTLGFDGLVGGALLSSFLVWF